MPRIILRHLVKLECSTIGCTKPADLWFKHRNKRNLPLEYIIACPTHAVEYGFCLACTEYFEPWSRDLDRNGTSRTYGICAQCQERGLNDITAHRWDEIFTTPLGIIAKLEDF